MADTLVKIGILGEEDAFEVEDSSARATAASGLEKAEEALALFPVSMVNGGTGGTTLPTARTALEIDYDLLLAQGLYAGRDLATVFADEIADYANDAEWFNARVIAGDFSGMRVFDYFDITLTDGKVFRYRIAAFDPYYKCMDTEQTVHHVIMVPDQVWPDSVPWNATNTNQGTASEKHPYLASNLHNWEVNTFYPLLPQKWKSVIANHRLLLEERYNASSTLTSSTAWSWANVGKVFSLSEVEVFGRCVWGTPGYSEGVDCFFQTFFLLAKHRIRRNHSDARCSWWLRGAHGGDATNALSCDNIGYPGNDTAASTGVRALPCFRVGV